MKVKKRHPNYRPRLVDNSRADNARPDQINFSDSLLFAGITEAPLLTPHGDAEIDSCLLVRVSVCLSLHSFTEEINSPSHCPRQHSLGIHFNITQMLNVNTQPNECMYVLSMLNIKSFIKYIHGFTLKRFQCFMNANEINSQKYTYIVTQTNAVYFVTFFFSG